jgi:Methylamine utilisation protein MauE
LSATHEVAGVLLAQLAAFLAVLLVACAAHKALAWRRTWTVVQNFAGVPRAAASGAVLAACAIEGLAGLLLILPDCRRVGAAFAAAILGLYLALIARAVAQRHGAVDCGCSFGASSRRLGPFEIARNAVLLAAALLVLAFADAAAPMVASQLLAACALLALYAAVDQLAALQPLRRGTVL